MKPYKIVIPFVLLTMLISCANDPLPTPTDVNFDIMGSSWTPLGGERYSARGKTVYDMATIDGEIFFATDDGVYTKDGSENFSRLADNAGLTEECEENEKCPVISNIAIDKSNKTIYALKAGGQTANGKLTGNIYVFEETKWQPVNDTQTLAIAAANENLYAIHAGSYKFSNQALTIYKPGESKTHELYYLDAGEIRELACSSVAVHAISGTVYFACETGLYSLNIKTNKIRPEYEYPASCASKYSCRSIVFEKIASGFGDHMLIGATKEAFTGIKVFLHTMDTIIEEISDEHVGPFDIDEASLVAFDPSNYAIYENNVIWNEISDASSLLDHFYSRTSNLCYLPDKESIIGMYPTSSFEISEGELAGEPLSITAVVEKCDSFFDDTSSVNMKTAYGDITDYHKIDEKNLEFATTDKGHVICKYADGDWGLITPPISDFFATSIAVDTANSVLYLSTESSGLFTLNLNNLS